MAGVISIPIVSILSLVYGAHRVSALLKVHLLSQLLVLHGDGNRVWLGSAANWLEIVWWVNLVGLLVPLPILGRSDALLVHRVWSVHQVVAGIELSMAFLHWLFIHLVVVVWRHRLVLFELVTILVLRRGADEVLGLARVVHIVLFHLSHHESLLCALALIDADLLVLPVRGVRLVLVTMLLLFLIGIGILDGTVVWGDIGVLLGRVHVVRSLLVWRVHHVGVCATRAIVVLVHVVRVHWVVVAALEAHRSSSALISWRNWEVTARIGGLRMYLVDAVMAVARVRWNSIWRIIPRMSSMGHWVIPRWVISLVSAVMGLAVTHVSHVLLSTEVVYRELLGCVILDSCSLIVADT
jgi:hypothetical protein